MTNNKEKTEITNCFHCNRCGLEEFVFALDDVPLDEAFAANYLCHDCEELVIAMHAAAESPALPANSTPRLLKDA